MESGNETYLRNLPFYTSCTTRARGPRAVFVTQVVEGRLVVTVFHSALLYLSPPRATLVGLAS
jgi:hypothetical protein